MFSGPTTAEQARQHALRALGRYLGAETTLADLIASLPQAELAPSFVPVRVLLPEWAADLGVGSPPALLVDGSCLISGDDPAHERCDWLLAAFLHLEGWLEQAVEAAKGPVQSYAYRIPAAASGAYDAAWVNRIALFLRRALARRAGLAEDTLFGPVPTARIILTHDVDALSKTIQLRIKSGIMSAIAVLRHLAGLRWAKAFSRLRDGLGFALRNANYDLFEEIRQEEARRGFKSIFLFADYAPGHGFKSWLIDPSYRVGEQPICDRVKALHAQGWQIGMHPGFNTWQDVAMLARTRAAVGAALGQPITICRQHWLRFSWARTWKAQHAAGVRLDFTLGFNDRPGLRNGAALDYAPWDHAAGAPIGIRSIPTVFMDSHFYDYAFPDDPAAAMAPWIDELIAVGGEASIIWHSQTMHPEYGWAKGYYALLDLLVARKANVVLAAPDAR